MDVVALLTLFNWVASVPAVVEFIVAAAALLTALAVIKKYVWTPLRGFHNKANRAFDSIVGYDAVLDPATGREIQPATPPLANRVFDLEEAHRDIAQALQTFAKTHETVVDLQRRWEEREAAGMQIIQEWTDWRDHHEKEAAEREERLAEWEKWRQEQTLLTATMVEAKDIVNNK